MLVLLPLMALVSSAAANAACVITTTTTVNCTHADRTTGINASNTGAGAVQITTGAAEISGGSANPGISAASQQGPLSVMVGRGGVSTDDPYTSAIFLTSSGNVSVDARGPVSGNGPGFLGIIHGGVDAVENGTGNISIGGSGTFFGQFGRAIWGLQNHRGLGGILVTGKGDTVEGSAAQGCCSAIRAQIDNPNDAGNITINRSGDIDAVNTLTPVPLAVSSGIHALTAGTGNITIERRNAASTISNNGSFGIDAEAFGNTSSGNITIFSNNHLFSGGAGIFTSNSAFSLPRSDHSKINVTNTGTISSGTLPNPVGLFAFVPGDKLGTAITEGGGVALTPAGISAGYNGGPVFTTGPQTAPDSPYTSCGSTGCTTLAPNQNINGTVRVNNSGAINAIAGDGIFAFNFGNGNVSVNARQNSAIQAAGDGILAEGFGSGKVDIKNNGTLSSANVPYSNTYSFGENILGTMAAVSASSNHGIHIANTGEIVSTGSGDGILTDATQGRVTINNRGTIAVADGFAIQTVGKSASVANAGTVIGAFSVVGNLVNTGIWQINPATAPSSSVSGTASLAGTFNAVFGNGGYLKSQYTVLASGGLNGTTFSAFTTTGLPAGFSTSLSYSADDVFLNVKGEVSTAGLSVNQTNVATALNTYFDNGGALPPAFTNVFGLTGTALGNALTQMEGQTAADAAVGALQLTNQFLNLMLDPFVDGRLGVGSVSGQAMAFAPDETASLPPEIALAYAGVFKAPAPPAFEQRWSAWGASYGGGNWTTGNTAVGSSNVSAQTYGVVAGMDYHLSPDTIVGFAIGGGGTAWGLAGGLGAGRSDAFQSGVYAMTRQGPAYLATALAFANHWMTTNRAVQGDALAANFDAQSYGGRVEGGYRYAVLPTFGVAPYAALQAQDFHTPSYGESDLTSGGFGLSYAAMNTTDVRSEIGARFDNPEVIAGMPLLLRARVAWAHDWVSNPSLSAAFESLPGTTFTVNGAPMPQNSALNSAGAELFITPRWSIFVRFDGEFAPGSQTYGGSGTLRYIW